MPGQSFEIVSVSAETPDIRRLDLKPVEGPLPAWQAGAHIRVHLTAGGSRAYSLLALPDLPADQIALGVLKEPESTGGSRFMHALQPGDRVKLSPPENHFPLGDHDGPALLIAGGIGITPILSMAASLAKDGRPYQVHYAGRHAGALAFLPEMQAICGDKLTVHYDDQPSALNIDIVIANAAPDAQIYVCGPAGLIDAVKATAKSHDWHESRIRFELFTTETDTSGDTPFDVEIHGTGQIVHVPADKTIIEALEEAGLDPLYDCQRGDCGICQCDVIEGIPDHRDVILSDSEKAANDVMQICVSRSKTPKLVLDL